MIAGLLWEVDAMGLGVITWKARRGGWNCFCSKLGDMRIPHVAHGETPELALYELVVFARRIL